MLFRTLSGCHFHMSSRIERARAERDDAGIEPAARRGQDLEPPQVVLEPRSHGIAHVERARDRGHRQPALAERLGNPDARALVEPSGSVGSPMHDMLNWMCVKPVGRRPRRASLRASAAGTSWRRFPGASHTSDHADEVDGYSKFERSPRVTPPTNAIRASNAGTRSWRRSHARPVRE